MFTLLGVVLRHCVSGLEDFFPSPRFGVLLNTPKWSGTGRKSRDEAGEAETLGARRCVCGSERFPETMVLRAPNCAKME